MSAIRHLVEHVADRIHASGDAEARAWGLTVERLPWGRRVIYDPRIATLVAHRTRTTVRPTLRRAA